MQTSVLQPTTYHNQALCVAGIEFGIGDTIPYISYKANNLENVIKNAVLTEVGNGSITVKNHTGEKICMSTKEITEINEEL